jgi:RDD family
LSRLDELDLTAGTRPGASAARPNDLAGASLSGAAAESAAETPGLVDLPLVASGAPTPGRVILRTPSVAAVEAAPPAKEDGGAAPLAARGAAFAADAALVLLLAAAALLAATAGRGQPLRLQGLVWTAAFAVYLSFFSTVVPLILFGKTVGMALTGLTARGSKGVPLTAVESSRRWLGTALTVAGLGAPLVATWRHREAPSPGDRLSGRSLTVEEIARS